MPPVWLSALPDVSVSLTCLEVEGAYGGCMDVRAPAQILNLLRREFARALTIQYTVAAHFASLVAEGVAVDRSSFWIHGNIHRVQCPAPTQSSEFFRG